MQNLKDALSDLKAEVVNGKALADLLADIAADYSVNPALLARKFAESYGSEEALRGNAAAIGKSEAPRPAYLTRVAIHGRASADQVAVAVAGMCARYNVPVSATVKVEMDGRIYTVICHLTSCPTWRYRAVRHADAACLKLARTAKFTTVN